MTQEDNKHNAAINILLAEDTEDDIVITREAFKTVKIKNNLYVVRDGQEALDFIYHEGKYKDKQKYPRPDLIILDINMPKMDGFQVLEDIKQNCKYSMIPVIMLTSSKNEDDIARSYRSQAASYIHKPVDYEEFVKLIDTFMVYWAQINRLP